MKQLPACALVWRLSVIREVVLSGFQLELYTSEEKPFAYWYASQVMDAHLACLDDMLLAVEPGTAACPRTPAPAFSLCRNRLSRVPGIAIPAQSALCLASYDDPHVRRTCLPRLDFLEAN
jgi:hypothetical protein